MSHMAVLRAKAPSLSVGSVAAAPANSWDIVSPGKTPWSVLLPIEQAHPILRFNPYILHGYRCNLRLWHCLRSMAFLHNESFNSISHFTAFLYFSAVALRFYKEGAYPNLLQAIPTCICMALSVTYHTFMNCICCYRRLLIADVIGIWVTMFFGFSLFFLQSCILPHAPVLKAAFIAYIAVGLITLFFLICARSAQWRAITLLSMSLIRIFSIASSMLISGGGSISSSSSSAQALWHWAFMEFFVVLGAVINVLKVPERLWPGAFNFFFNSHQIMHIFSIIGLTLMMRAGELDRQPGCWNPMIFEVRSSQTEEAAGNFM